MAGKESEPDFFERVAYRNLAQIHTQARQIGGEYYGNPKETEYWKQHIPDVITEISKTAPDVPPPKRVVVLATPKEEWYGQRVHPRLRHGKRALGFHRENSIYIAKTPIVGKTKGETKYSLNSKYGFNPTYCALHEYGHYYHRKKYPKEYRGATFAERERFADQFANRRVTFIRKYKPTVL